MPVKVAKNQERAVEDAYRVARLKREHRAKGSNLSRLDKRAEGRARVSADMRDRGRMIMTDYERALRDPRAVFSEPREVLTAQGLSADQKRAILDSWRQDALRLSASEGENMAGGEEPMLQRVCDALHELEPRTGL